ncbi:MAG: dTMP kinase [Anaeromyxobacteraceae bacterium]
MSPAGRRGRAAGRGRFLVVEGLDGAGTTTQARLLGDRLRSAGRRVHVTAEPSGGPVGALVRQILSGRLRGRAPDGAFDADALALLFAADRVDHARAEILPALAEGIDVISDRYTLSSLAYQSLTTGDPRWVQAINSRAPAPDVTIFLRVGHSVAFERRRAASHAREIYEKAAFQRRVAEAYERAIAVLRRKGERVEILDGSAAPAAVTDAIERVVGALRPARR